jgi:Arc/MetJ-type ribon-helix-helix transcriptional regulator
MKRFLVVVVVVVLAFFAGYGLMYWKARDAASAAQTARQSLESQLADTQDRLRAANLEGQLGLLLIDVEQNNFGTAQERSTKFFDAVRAAVYASRDEAVRHKLDTLLQSRDEVTAGLTALKPGTADLLRKLYTEYAATGAPQEAAH